jgi:2-amino-4-hydroxy-6-hydroxymethyldihydropteridine diphosphokinase|tara:strand:+ start:147 stop:662 length:516 start_codon:yes stop_codon:yes gene_type:complete
MIHLNIGSNLDSKHGSRFDNIFIAIDLLINSKIKIKKISNFYETPSYPNNNFPKFLNVGLLIDYNNDCFNLFKIIKKIEKKLGRIRTKKNDPRVIDIDIIDFRSEVKKTKELILPHPRCHLRNFVLFPILQIDPNWSHPILKKNARFLINNLDRKLRIEITRLQKNVNIQT